MKKISLYLYAVLVIFMVEACGGSDKNSNTQGGDNASNQSPMNNGQSTGSKMQAGNNAEMNDTIKADTLSGQEIIDKTLFKMNNKFTFQGDQRASMKDVLTKSFMESGGDLNKRYSKVEAKNASREMIQRSSDKISAILDSAQQVQFNNFLHH